MNPDPDNETQNVNRDADPVSNGKRDEQVALIHPCNQQEFNAACEYTIPKEPGLKSKFQQREWTVKSIIIYLLPVLDWLPKYQWKEDLFSDVISGLTVAVMHIPQGMAYSSLAGVPPIVGIYMAFFPVLIYFFFGSSRHVSMGTFAVVCMMAGKPIMMYATPPEAPPNNLNVTSVEAALTEPSYTPIQVATIVCLVVGLWQVVLGVCRLGSLSVLMSETLISGFTTGAAVLVFSTQIKHVFGVKLPRRSGPLRLIYTCIDTVRALHQTNYLALGMTLIVIAVLLAYFKQIKPRLERSYNFNFPIPMELIVIVLGTVISSHFQLKESLHITVVGEIPTGFPEPTLPPFALFPNVLVDGLVIAIVAFSINISMASMFARKERYKIDSNQELLASGFGNIVGSLFSCLPFAASLSRSLIQHGVGGKTQLASVVSSAILACVLLYIGPFFEPLPHCVLAGIILHALQGMLKQVEDLPKAWQRSRMDAMIWIVTFLTVVLVDIDVGLGVGIIVSLGVIILMGQYPYVYVLRNVANTDIYLESRRYHRTVIVPNTLIIRICGGLHFANKHNVKKKVEKLVKKELEEATNMDVNKLVIDMSAVTFVDPTSSQGFLNVDKDLEAKGITLCLASCTGHVYEQLKRSEFFVSFSEEKLFPTIHDAVEFIFAKDNVNLVNEER